ncbi:MAG: hypothetical protein JSV16_12830, partial [Candidatus Hydrogenedentota bacterium]
LDWGIGERQSRVIEHEIFGQHAVKVTPTSMFPTPKSASLTAGIIQQLIMPTSIMYSIIIPKR